MTLLELIIGLAVGAGVGIPVVACFNLLWRRLQDMMWPIRIPIIRQRGENLLWELDERGRSAKRKDGYEVIKLKKDKENIKPPKYDQVHINRKGKDVMPLFSPAKGSYIAVKMVEGPALETVEDKSAKNWGILEHQRINEDYKPHEGFWDKYGMIVMNATFAAMVIFFVIYNGQAMGNAASSLSGTANALTNAITKVYGSTATTTSSTATIIP
jgi:hypothetical protein